MNNEDEKKKVVEFKTKDTTTFNNVIIADISNVI